MSNARAAFLCKLASSITNLDTPAALLKSYYLMRCKGLSGDAGLLRKHFPPELTCSHCCIKWTYEECITIVQPKIITKSQKRKIKSLKQARSKKELFQDKSKLLNSNQLEKKCQLCKHCTYINLVKPESKRENKKTISNNNPKLNNGSKDAVIKIKKFDKSNNQLKVLNKEVNVYSSSKDVFSLHNKNNSIVVEKLKLTKTNKRKKDKFAGLRKEAVLTMAKIKKDKDVSTVDKLKLFLKTSN